MVETQCEARPVKAYIMSDLLKRFHFDTTNDFVKIVVGIVGFYVGLFYRTYIFFYFLPMMMIMINIFTYSFLKTVCAIFSEQLSPRNLLMVNLQKKIGSLHTN